MDRRSPVWDGANLVAIGVGNVDVPRAGDGDGGWVGWNVFLEGLVGYSDGCIEYRGNETGTRRG